MLEPYMTTIRATDAVDSRYAHSSDEHAGDRLATAHSVSQPMRRSKSLNLRDQRHNWIESTEVFLVALGRRGINTVRWGADRPSTGCRRAHAFSRNSEVGIGASPDLAWRVLGAGQRSP
jgi:hypothetical protein